MTSEAKSAELAAWLRERGAQHDVVVYASAFGDDLERFWAECPRGDWLLAIAIRAGVDGRVVALAAAEVAELARDFLPDDDSLAHEVLAASRRGVEEGAEVLASSVEELERSADHAPDPAVQAARMAIVCAARATSRPEEAAMVPALLAQAAAFDAGDCAMEASVAYTQRRCADLVRRRIGPPVGLSS